MLCFPVPLHTTSVSYPRCYFSQELLTSIRKNSTTRIRCTTQKTRTFTCTDCMTHTSVYRATWPIPHSNDLTLYRLRRRLWARFLPLFRLLLVAVGDVAFINHRSPRRRAHPAILLLQRDANVTATVPTSIARTPVEQMTRNELDALP